MRRPHFLSRPKSREIPGQCIWLDTETRGKKQQDGSEKHYLHFGWACYQRRLPTGNWTTPEWKRFTTRRQFWNWCIKKTRPKSKLYLFAHNGAFDLPVLGAFEQLPHRGFYMLSAIVDAPPMIIKWRNENATIQFVDTLNIWKMSLDELGESLGVPKLKMPGKRASKANWDSYCKRDVEVIRVAVLNWIAYLTENDLGQFMPTLASQGFYTYRYKFQPCQIVIDSDEDALALSRNSYVGGRTECFKIGKYEGKYYYLDVNSLYPHVMREYKYPCQLIGFYKRPSMPEIKRWVKDYAVVADCFIDTDKPIYPVIRDGRLIFPTGKFHCTLSPPDLECALQRGHLNKCYTCAVYYKDYLFTDYVDYFYNRRLEAKAKGNEVESVNNKLLLNTLYGKFGQRGRVYEDLYQTEDLNIEVWEELDDETGEVFKYREFGGMVQQWKDEGESRNSFPLISSSICAQGRQLLWRAIERAGKTNCYYCDTDSLIVNEAGYKRLRALIDPDKLGAWKLEQIVQKMQLHGPKDYVLDGDVKIKGIRKNAEKIGRAKYRQDLFIGFRGLLRRGNLDAPIVTKQTKSLKRQYKKGRVTKSGTVRPFTLHERMRRWWRSSDT